MQINGRFFFNRIKFIEKIHYKSSQSKDNRLVLVRLAEDFLKPALALYTLCTIYIIINI
jgi:hypothetical protein